MTSLAIVDNVETNLDVFLISSGWDRRICIWKLSTFELFSVYRNVHTVSTDEAEAAAAGSIVDMDYSPMLKAFAYASADGHIYVRKFSIKGDDMHLIHKISIQVESEATCIKWNHVTNEWVVGLENGEIRIWVKENQIGRAHV